MISSILFLAAPLLPIVCGLLCWFLPALRGDKARNGFVLFSLVAAFLLNLWLITLGDCQKLWFYLTPALPMVSRSDGISRLFSLLMSGMWMISGYFSFAYMAHENDQRRYYAFYLLTLGALLGICYAGTLVTMYVCFELMTLLSVALVLHNLTKEAVAAGIKYLIYSIAGAMMGLFGIFFFTANSPSPIFQAGGTVTAPQSPLLLAVLFITLIGFGTKAGMFPMHGWLPTAHPVAPAPASAVLSGVITKAGVLCIIRVVYYSVGPAFMRGTWVQTALLALTLITVFMGSMMAFREKVLKKRLAYSTVSQVSYILFGLYLLNQTAFTGALLHVYFHSIIKNALFLCAGAIIVKTGLTRTDELRGVGKRLPMTMWCFTLTSVGLVGIPPMSGFISKWYLAGGAIESGLAPFTWLGPVVLLVSALLTAGYLLPVSIDGFFPGKETGELGRIQEPVSFWIPLCLLAGLTLLLGVWPQALSTFAQAVAQGLM